MLTLIYLKELKFYQKMIILILMSLFNACVIYIQSSSKRLK